MNFSPFTMYPNFKEFIRKISSQKSISNFTSFTSYTRVMFNCVKTNFIQLDNFLNKDFLIFYKTYVFIKSNVYFKILFVSLGMLMWSIKNNIVECTGPRIYFIVMDPNFLQNVQHKLLICLYCPNIATNSVIITPTNSQNQAPNPSSPISSPGSSSTLSPISSYTTLNPSSSIFPICPPNISTTNIIPQAQAQAPSSNISLNNNALPLYPTPTNTTAYSCSLTCYQKNSQCAGKMVNLGTFTSIDKNYEKRKDYFNLKEDRHMTRVKSNYRYDGSHVSQTGKRQGIVGNNEIITPKESTNYTEYLGAGNYSEKEEVQQAAEIAALSTTFLKNRQVPNTSSNPVKPSTLTSGPNTKPIVSTPALVSAPAPVSAPISVSASPVPVSVPIYNTAPTTANPPAITTNDNNCSSSSSKNSSDDLV